MSGLSVEDVDAIREWWDGEREGDTAGSMLGRLDAVVAEIAGRHVRAAMTEAADSIREECPGDHLAKPCASCRAAARIVRNLADPQSSPPTSP